MVLGVLGSVLIVWQMVLSSVKIMTEEAGSSTQKLIAEKENLKFPLAIPNTWLIAQNPAVYEGGYIEDGSGDYVVDVAAIVLYNTASCGIERAYVALEWDEGIYEFEAKMLPPKAAVLVLEKNRKKYVEYRWTNCVGEQFAGEIWRDHANVSISKENDTELNIKNLTDKMVEDIRIYYKNYLPEENVYFGGITYCTGIDKLMPGENRVITPSNYVADYSRIVKISCTDGIG